MGYPNVGIELALLWNEPGLYARRLRPKVPSGGFMTAPRSLGHLTTREHGVGCC
jgi:hypothetical protein